MREAPQADRRVAQDETGNKTFIHRKEYMIPKIEIDLDSPGHGTVTVDGIPLNGIVKIGISAGVNQRSIVRLTMLCTKLKVKIKEGDIIKSEVKSCQE